MLLTGFDAPIEQVMYLDRSLKVHNLLQAIARVNKTCTMDISRKVDDNKVKKDSIVKQCGYVVDYYGVSDYLKEALAKNITIDVRKAVENNYVVDWTNNQSKTYDIERAIFMLINKNYFKLTLH